MNWEKNKNIIRKKIELTIKEYWKNEKLRRKKRSSILRILAKELEEMKIARKNHKLRLVSWAKMYINTGYPIVIFSE